MPPRHEPEYHPDHVPTPADRSPYWGDGETDPGRPEDWRDLAHLEQQAGEALHANEDDTQACGGAFPDMLDLDELAAAFAADEGMVIVHRCAICKSMPVDPLRGESICAVCRRLQGCP